VLTLIADGLSNAEIAERLTLSAKTVDHRGRTPQFGGAVRPYPRPSHPIGGPAMTYLQTPEQSPLYPVEQVALGYGPNYVRVFALLPEAYAGWRQLATSINHGMDERRYELAAARAVGSDYCTLAHENILRDRFGAALDPVDLSIMDFAGRVAADPTGITGAEIAALHGPGLSDVEVFQIVLAACARRFFSGVRSATGTVPDPELHIDERRTPCPAKQSSA
jgi:alkylhydroperoxidase family enzyme